MDPQAQLAQAIAELQAGRKGQARALLARLVQQAPGYADAWLALSACLDDPEQKRYCLDKVLSIDPDYPAARHALADLEEAAGAAGEDATGEGATSEEASVDDALDALESGGAIAAAGVVGAGLGAAMAPPEALPDETPAFTPDSMAELMAAAEEEEGTALEAEPGPDSWEQAFEDLDQPIHEFDPWEIPHAEEAGEPARELDPWEIPHAGEEDLPAWEAPAVAAGTAAAAGSWDVPAEWQTAAGAKPEDAEVDVRARAKRKPAEAEARSYAWYQVWLMAVTSPSERTYQKIVADPEARPGRGFLWVFIAGFISMLVTTGLFALRMQTLLPEYIQQMGFAAPEISAQLAAINYQQIFGYVLIGMIVGSPFVAGLAVLGVIIQAAIYQLIAKFMIGEGTFGEMAYALSAITAPITLISIIFSLPIPVLNIAGALLSLYTLFLTLVAIKAVNRFGWGGACGTVIAVPILIGICSCLVFFLAATSGGSGLEGLPVP